jgi:hypothetical protein
MSIKLFIALVIGAAITTPALADEKYELAKSPITDRLGWSGHIISLKNNTDATVTVSVECGFFNHDQLVGRDSAGFVNVRPGQTVDIKGDADCTDCRIDAMFKGGGFLRP